MDYPSERRIAKSLFEGCPDLSACREVIKKYNSETNVGIDRAGYRLFEGGLATDREALRAQVYFIGKHYGGAVYVSDRMRESESCVIAENLLRDEDWYRSTVRGMRPLIETLPSDDQLVARLLAPYLTVELTKKWFVWGTKFLYFLRPEVFPPVDKHVREELGLKDRKDAKGYLAAMSKIREIALRNLDFLEDLRAWDPGPCPFVIKVLDKLFYVEGKCVEQAGGSRAGT